VSDDTYYTILNVKETASSAEIKTAYRDLIRQVHPDTIANLGPYLRNIAEDKAKEINEAYSILSDSSKRRDYDRQLAEYRRQNASQTPPPPPPQQPSPQAASGTSSWPYCNRCGTALHVSGFCPKCNSFAGAGKWPRAARWIGYGVALLVRWSREHPILFSFAIGAAFLF
jgi:curved DNA-binding protein CbpA